MEEIKKKYRKDNICPKCGIQERMFDQSYCSICWKTWQEEHKEQIDISIKENVEKTRTLWTNFFQEEITKRDNRCSVCKSSFPQECYEWHHRNPSEKEFCIMNIAQNSYSVKNIEKVKIELEKCDLVCSNCHTIITKYSFGNFGEYRGRTDIKNSSSTIDFGYYSIIARTQNGGRIDADREYICTIERIGMDLLRIVMKEKDCKCLKDTEEQEKS